MLDGSLSAREEQARRLTETLRRQLEPTLCSLMQTPDVVELIRMPAEAPSLPGWTVWIVAESLHLTLDFHSLHPILVSSSL
jgi:hypothetical protein